MEKRELVFRIAAGMGFLGVALGAFGAHGLESVLETNDRMEEWRTATFYHLVHSVAALTICIQSRPFLLPAICFLSGNFIFAGSLYTLSITNMTSLGIITPIGGLLYLIGWFSLILQGSPSKP